MSASARRSAGATGREAEEELRRQKQRLEPVLEISPTAMIITDLDTNVVAWNRAAERLFGYTSDEAPAVISTTSWPRPRVINEVPDAIVGLGPIEFLLKDPEVTEVLLSSRARRVS